MPMSVGTDDGEEDDDGKEDDEEDDGEEDDDGKEDDGDLVFLRLLFGCKRIKNLLQ
jgi:hypothetical protein